MKKRTVILTGIIILLWSLQPTTAVAQQSKDIILAGYKIKPTVRTTGSGFVTVSLHNDSLSVDGEFSDLMSPYYGAYIMGEIRGSAGNVIQKLKVDLSDSKTDGVINKKKNTFALTAGQLALLNKGNLYITVASQEHQTGEILGKIPPIQ